MLTPLRYIIAFLLVCILFVIGSSIYIYHGHHHEDHEATEKGVFPKDDTIIDMEKSFMRDGREKVVCYRESHRNFYIFTLQLALVILALTTYGVFTKMRLSKRLSRQNKQLEESRETLARTNQAMLAGIRYARRIQHSMLPSPLTLNELADDGFIFYQPKDVVSGDFYWLGNVQGRRLFCVADCTGHGVPGAFLATLGLNMLRTVLETEKLWRPDDILHRVNKHLCQGLGLAGSEADADGIEMTIICLDDATSELHFAGARGVALHISDGTLLELKGDRITLGHEPDAFFTLHSLLFSAGDWCYQFTDGFPDQFGGPDQKKFSRGRLKKTLQEFAVTSAPNGSIEQAFAAWKGHTPQVDDVLVLGFRA